MSKNIYTGICPKCQKSFTKKIKNNYIPKFCSRSCASSRGVMSEKQKEYRRQWAKNNPVGFAANKKPKIKKYHKGVCPKCQKPFTKEIKGGYKPIFCSRSCANGKAHSEKTKLKISKSNKSTPYIKRIKKTYTEVKKTNCMLCDKLFWVPAKSIKKYCSTLCCNKASSIRMSEWLKHNRDHIKGPHRKSYMEESFEKWLNNHDCPRWFDQVYFWNEEKKKNGWADYVFPSLKLIIELDGSHHKKRKRLDQVRDEYLYRIRGYNVVRITHTDYIKKTQVDYIKQLLGVI